MCTADGRDSTALSAGQYQSASDHCSLVSDVVETAASPRADRIAEVAVDL